MDTPDFVCVELSIEMDEPPLLHQIWRTGAALTSASKDHVRDAQHFARDCGVPLAIDGVNGAMTRRFVAAFQHAFQLAEYGSAALRVDGSPGPETIAAMQISRVSGLRASNSFRWREFLTRGPRSLGPQNDVLLVTRRQLAALQRLRDLIGQPLHLVSTYRDPKHNRAIGGVVGSRHTLGMAADIDRHATARAISEAEAESCGFTGIGMVSRTNPDVVHVDTRDQPARWFYE